MLFAAPNPGLARPLCCYRSATMADLKTQIHDNAGGPKRVEVDGQTVEQHPLKDQIAADEYLRETTAGTRKKLPIRLAKLRPGSTT